MGMTRRHTAAIFAVTALVVVASFVVTFLLLTGRDGSPSVSTGIINEHVPIMKDQEAQLEPLNLEEALRRDLDAADSEEAKIEVLNRFAQDPQARSNSSALRASILVEKSPRVRLKAFQTARDLALKEDRSALISILKHGVGNPYSEVRRESLRACRDNPHYELLNDLLEVAERGGQDRSIAIQALAFMDDPEAQRKVLETAQSMDVPKDHRIQAITLLSRTRLNEAVSYLQELATSDDSELKRYAMEALQIWQNNQSGN